MCSESIYDSSNRVVFSAYRGNTMLSVNWPEVLTHTPISFHLAIVPPLAFDGIGWRASLSLVIIPTILLLHQRVILWTIGPVVMIVGVLSYL